VNHRVSRFVNHAGIPVVNPGDTIGMYHDNEGFHHGFSDRFPTGYRRDAHRALESRRVQESRRFYLHRAPLRLPNYSSDAEGSCINCSRMGLTT
jgi:hypothetical protein